MTNLSNNKKSGSLNAPKRKAEAVPSGTGVNLSSGRHLSGSSAKNTHSATDAHTLAATTNAPKPKMSLALKFALPVAGALLIVFFLMAFLLTRMMTTAVSQEIVKSGVAQVSMLAKIANIIVAEITGEANSNNEHWAVKSGLISAEKFDELYYQQEFKPKFVKETNDKGETINAPRVLTESERKAILDAVLKEIGTLSQTPAEVPAEVIKVKGKVVPPPQPVAVKKTTEIAERIVDEIIAKARVNNHWAVNMGLISGRKFDELYQQQEFKTRSGTRVNRHGTTVVEELDIPGAEQKMMRSLYAGQRGALLKKFITSDFAGGKPFRTQTAAAYIIITDPELANKYGIPKPPFILASADERELPKNAFAGVTIEDNNRWLPMGVDLVHYHVGEVEHEFSDDYIYGGVANNIEVLVFLAPIFSLTDKTKKIGEVMVGIDARELIVAVSSIKFIAIVGGMLGTIIAILTCLFVGYNAVKPIAVLVKDMNAVAHGQLERKCHVKTNDEIGMLAHQFNDMTVKLKGAVQNEKKMAAVESELDMAREIQKKLLPDKLPRIKGFDLYAVYHPAKEVGGDYYDFLPIDGRHVGIIVADVSGKGVPGSMVMATTRTILRFTAAGNISAADTLKRTNSMVAADIKRGMFVTAFYMVLDVVERKILCSSAGHNPMMIIHDDESYELINPNGIALGFDKGRVFDRTIKEQEITLRSGDRVVAYTDGVVEAMNLANEEYTDERFFEFVQTHHRLASEQFVVSLLTDLDAHQRSKDTRHKKAEPHDDITIVTFRVL